MSMSLISINDLPNEIINHILSYIGVDIKQTVLVSRLWKELSIRAGGYLARPVQTAIKLSQIHPDPLVLKEVMEQPLPQFQNLREFRTYMLRLGRDYIFLEDVCVKLFEKDEINAAKDLIKTNPDDQGRTDTLISVCKRLSDPSIKIKVAVLIPEECTKNEVLKNIFEESVKKSDIEGALKVVNKMPEKDKSLYLKKLSSILIKKGDIEGALKVVDKIPKKDQNEHLKTLSWTLIDKNDIEGALKVVAKIPQEDKNKHLKYLSWTLMDKGFVEDAIYVTVKISNEDEKNMALRSISLELVKKDNKTGALNVAAMILDEEEKKSVLQDISDYCDSKSSCQKISASWSPSWHSSTSYTPNTFYQ